MLVEHPLLAPASKKLRIMVAEARAKVAKEAGVAPEDVRCYREETSPGCYYFRVVNRRKRHAS
jgi:hypothetical protein